MNIIPVYYHMVSNDLNPLVSHLYRYKDVDNFRKDIQVLARKYPILDFDDIKSNKKGVVLTFDDGFKECYTVIFPILQELSLPAFFFINNDFLDNKDMFYRAKLSLLIDKIPRISLARQKSLAKLLRCSVVSLKKKIKHLRYYDQRVIEELLELAEIDVAEYLKYNKPYLTSSQIESMIDAGYYFGGHTDNHLSLSNLSKDQQIRKISESSHQLQKKFNLSYKICSLPHNDAGLKKQVFQEVSEEIEILFGGFGLHHQPQYNYLRRISNEHWGMRIDHFIKIWKAIHLVTNI